MYVGSRKAYKESYDLTLAGTRTMRKLSFAVTCLRLWLFVLTFAFVEESFSEVKQVQFNRDVRPILSNHCFACHGPDEKQRKAKLRLDLKESLFEERKNVLIARGKPGASELFLRVTHSDSKERMPPEDFPKPLKASQVNTIKAWIEQGAHWEDHWSYTPPRIPSLTGKEEHLSPIDHFIRKRLNNTELSPARPTDSRTLVRRLHLDLLGLPPAPSVVEAFAGNPSTQAYAKLVDKLLASPHFGERLALPWLDLARYADSVGYQKDSLRDCWLYRDYLIRAFNENKPYDQFVIEQLAGDLLEGDPLEKRSWLIASGLNRMNQTTSEGGAQSKEYVAKYAADRVRNTAAIFLGSTMGCAECHDHKYDPFTTQDFYAFAAFFADIKERGVGYPEHTPMPTYAIMDEQVDLQKQLFELKKKMAGFPSQPQLVSRHVAEEDTVAPVITLNGAATVHVGVGVSYVDSGATALDALEGRLVVTSESSPPMANLVLHWSLDYLDGTTIPDSSGRGNHGTLKGADPATVVIEGKLGKAINLQSLNGYIDRPHNDSLNLQELSAACWFKSTDNGAWFHNIFGKYGYSSETPFWGLGWTRNDNIGFTVRDSAKTWLVAKPPSGWGLDGEWHHIAGIRSSGKVQFYGDGKLMGAVDDTTIDIRNTRQVSVGRHSGTYAKVAVDDIRLYNRGLTNSEIAVLFTGGGLDTSEAGEKTVNYTVVDSSGNLAKAKRTVIVSKDPPPSLRLIGEAEVTHQVGTLFTDPGAEVVDASGNIMVEAEVQVSGTVDPGMREKQILTYGHRDGQGRELAPVVRRITVLDKTRENEKQELKSRILTLEKRLEQLTNAKTWPKTLVTLQAKPRMVRLLPRGNWLDDSGPIMQPAIPTFLGKLDRGESRATRLDLARWIASRDNPLTARVFVNRVWKQFFGKGLARDLDDLGAQGQRPTHPKLLDWLAVDFMENGWDIKRHIRQIVTSEAYRRSSNHPTSTKLDPENRLLARQGAFRLEAELIRDNALAISGLLVPKIGGRSVKPYQPSNYWFRLYNSGKYVQDKGEELYRRGIYTLWRRSFWHPSLQAFDAPAREECVAERPISNTPQQALVLLNDPTYVEAARLFAERILTSHTQNLTRLDLAFRLALARPPNNEERLILQKLLEKERKIYSENKNAAQALLTTGEKPYNETIDPVELAAWTSVARTLLNLHETITRN